MEKQHRKPPSRAGKGPTPSSWKPGQSGNPNGRPRTGLAFAERVRERVDPDMVIELAMRVAEDESLTPSERLIALWPLIDRGFVKPPQTIDATLTQGHAPQYDWSRMPLERRREILAELRALRIRGESDAGDLPTSTPSMSLTSGEVVTDGES